jgi:hypothetical protein
MKVLVWILLMANAIFFAAMQWGGLLIADEQAVQAQPPLHEEKIGLQGAPQGKPAPASPAPAPAAAAAPAPAPEEVPAPLAAGPGALCMEWGEFSGAELARATAALSALQLGDRLGQRQVEYAIGYWVYIPPQKDKASVNRKIAQLKARGIEEYFVVSEAGPWQNAISLGVFKTQEAAQHFLDDLRRSKDVRSAQVGERASQLKATIFVLNGLDDRAAASLAEVQKGFAGSELKDVACTH